MFDESPMSFDSLIAVIEARNEWFRIKRKHESHEPAEDKTS